MTERLTVRERGVLTTRAGAEVTFDPAAAQTNMMVRTSQWRAAEQTTGPFTRLCVSRPDHGICTLQGNHA